MTFVLGASPAENGADGAARLPSPETTRRIGGRFHPGGQGNGIFQLLRVSRNGRPHLVGMQSKSGEIVDFTTGEVLFDFSCFGPGPILAGDSYETACAWYNPSTAKDYYSFGGWVKAPGLLGAVNEYSGKHSYVVATYDFVTWDILLNDGPITATTSMTITSTAVSGSTTILTMSAAVPTYISLGHSLVVAGVTGAGATAVNGTQAITGVSGSTVTVNVTTTGAGTGGTATYTDNQTRWKAEVSDLVPTDIVPAGVGGTQGTGGLFWFRSDINTASPMGDENCGVWGYQGGAPLASVGGTNTIPAVGNTTGTYVALGSATGVTQLSTTLGYKGYVHNDRLYWAINTNSMWYYDLVNGGSVQASSTWAPTSRSLAGGTLATGYQKQGAFGRINGQLVLGQSNGIIIGAPGSTSPIFIPLFVGNKVDSTGTVIRSAGWRSRTKEVGGGIVFAVNPTTSTADDDIPAFLLWLGPGGVIKVIDANIGSVQGIEVFDGRLYYGVTNGYDNGTYGNYRLDNPQLASIPLDQVKTRVVAWKDTLAGNASSFAYTAGTSGVSGTMGGWPTFGQTAGRLRFESDTTGTLTIAEMGATQQGVGTRTLCTVAVTGGTNVLVDLGAGTAQGGTLSGLIGDTLLTGNPLAWTYSVSAGIKAEVYFR